MGNTCCNCKFKSSKSYAFHTDVGNALIQELMPKLDNESFVVILKLKSITDLNRDPKIPSLNPYIELKLKVRYCHLLIL